MKRLALLLALCLTLPITLLAADNPALGAWKLNLEKSKFPAGMAPKSLTRTITADGDNVKYAFEGQAADGSALAYSFTVQYGEKDYEVTGSAPYGADHI